MLVRCEGILANPTTTLLVCLVWLAVFHVKPVRGDEDLAKEISSVIQLRCAMCHAAEEPEGDVNLVAIRSQRDLLSQPELIRQMMEAVDAASMPPESEPEFSDNDRSAFLKLLKRSLGLAVADEEAPRVPIHRLNRFQYNNAIRDLFALDRDVFPLPERLMTRRSNYLDPVVDRMPDEVDVSCDALEPLGGMRDVEPFPKDLQAEHGFDNQADRLTLPPLLLDAMMDVCVSILDSADFNSTTVGIWDDHFAKPATDAERGVVLRQRIRRFTRFAFRGPVQERTIERYVDYIEKRLDRGMPFEDAMKAGTAAILSSPKFLFRIWEASPKEENAAFGLASRLSFSLWGSGPDEQLLQLAESGELTDETVLDKTVQRMLRDPKIARFLDSFPAQWLKLESILSAAPDPGKNRLYNIGKKPAGLQMVLEPLLLFDMVFLENKPLQELISPQHSWRNDFLRDWYETDLKPQPVDEQHVSDENKKLFARRELLHAELLQLSSELDRLTKDARKQVLEERQAEIRDWGTYDLSPIAAWDFNGDSTDSVGDLDLGVHGDVEFRDGAVVLDGGYLESPLLKADLESRTLEIWLRLEDVNQKPAVAMGLTNNSRTVFDAIAFDGQEGNQWIARSNDPFLYPSATMEEDETSSGLLQLVLTRDKDGRASMYRNGKQFGTPNRSRSRNFKANDTRVVLGRLLVPRKPDVRLRVAINRARLYDKVLTAEQVQALYDGPERFVSVGDSINLLTPDERNASASLQKRIALKSQEFQKLPLPTNLKDLTSRARKEFESRLVEKMNSRFRRVPIHDERYGGIVTNAAVLTMTSSPTHSQPIARGVWLTEVVFNNPPPPPPNDIPTLDESVADKSLTVRERFARHRADPDCAACHARIDPLGFALENFDVVGRWRDRYPNQRPVDPAGTLLKTKEFKDVIAFKQVLIDERHRFARAFTKHFARFFAARELSAKDEIEIDRIVEAVSEQNYRLRDIIQAVCQSRRFSP